MTLNQKIARNTIYQIIGKIVATAFGVMAIALMTRYLGQEGFGGYTTITAYLQFFGILADMGLSVVLLQMIAQPGANRDKIVSNMVTIRIISAVIFLGLAPIVVLFFPYSPLIKLAVAITAIGFFFMSLNQILVGVFQRELKTGRVAIAEMVSRVILVIFVIIAWVMDTGLLGIMIAVILGSITHFLINYIFSLKYVRIRWEIDLQVWREIVHKSWPIAISIIFNLVYLRADAIILSLTRSQAEVGIYGAAYRVVDILIVFPMMFMGLILPLLSQYWAEKNKLDFKNMLQKSFNMLSIIAIPLVVGTLFLAKPVMVLIAGQDFAVSGSVLKIIMLACAFVFLGSLFAHTIVAINKQKLMIWAYVTTALLSMTGYIILIPKYSYFAAAWITVFSEVLIAVISFAVVWKFTKVLPNFKVFGKALLASAVMALLLWLMAGYNVGLMLVIAIVTYFCVLYLVRGFSKEMVKEILTLKK